MTLRELGFRQPLTLSGQESQREIYLPVPAGVPTRDAQLQLDGRYVRGHTGRSSGLWSVDGDPVAARSITDAQGDASQLLAIDGEPRDNGFVRVGVGWWSIVSDYRCADQSAPANVLRLSPDSRFSYRFDGRAVDTVAKAGNDVHFLVRTGRAAIMGPDQAATVMALVRRQINKTEGKEWTPEEEEAFKAPVRKIYEDFQPAANFSSNLWVDGIIDPVETRDAMGLLLDLASRTAAKPTPFGVFRF